MKLSHGNWWNVIERVSWLLKLILEFAEIKGSPTQCGKIVWKVLTLCEKSVGIKQIRHTTFHRYSIQHSISFLGISYLYSIRNTKYQSPDTKDRLRKGMKNPGVFQKIAKPPCLSLSLRENERFPIPHLGNFWKNQVFTPSLSVSAYSLIISLIISLVNCQNIV